MNAHKNARLMPYSRAVLVRRVVEGGQMPKTAEKWVARFRIEDIAGLRDRSSRPHKLRQPAPEYVMHRIETLRHQRWTGQRITTKLGISPSTVNRTPRRLGLSRIKDINLLPPPHHYEHSRPGEMIHIDIKKLGRFKAPEHRITGWHASMHRSGGAGWEYLHVCIDDYFHVAFSAVMPGQTARSAIAFLQAAGVYYQNFGITIERVMTDNVPCYTSRIFRNLCTERDIRHIRTRPYTPKTNDKAERFIQTASRELAYAVTYQTSTQRDDQLPAWLHRYNWHRPHGSLKKQVPISRLGLGGDNLLKFHT